MVTFACYRQTKHNDFYHLLLIFFLNNLSKKVKIAHVFHMFRQIINYD